MITAVIFVHNRFDPAMEKCFNSLINCGFKIVVVDYGSSPNFIEKVRNLCNSKKIVYHYHKTDDNIWCQAHAFNIGVGLSDTRYVMTTGCDFIFHPQFMHKLEGLLGERKFILAQAAKLTTAITNEDYLSDVGFNVLMSKAHIHPRYGDGACQCASRQFFIEHPYDERLKLWGGTDNLMHQTAKKSGMECVWINDIYKGYRIIHQPHPIKQRIGPEVYGDEYTKWRKRNSAIVNDSGYKTD